MLRNLNLHDKRKTTEERINGEENKNIFLKLTDTVDAYLFKVIIVTKYWVKKSDMNDHIIHEGWGMRGRNLEYWEYDIQDEQRIVKIYTENSRIIIIF